MKVQKHIYRTTTYFRGRNLIQQSVIKEKKKSTLEIFI